jgi:hypothetical protein
MGVAHGGGRALCWNGCWDRWEEDGEEGRERCGRGEHQDLEAQDVPSIHQSVSPLLLSSFKALAEEDDQLIRFSCQSCLLKLEGNKEAPNPRTTRPTERPTQSELRSVVQERSCSRRRSGSYSPVGKRTSTSPSASLSEGV